MDVISLNRYVCPLLLNVFVYMLILTLDKLGDFIFFTYT